MYQTPLHPLTLALSLVLGVVLVLVPRRFAALPIIIAAIFVPSDQRIIVASLDFSMIRILILFGLARLALRGEWRSLQINRIDQLVALYVLALGIAGTLLYLTMAVFVNRLGSAFDILGMYFYCRAQIRSWRDIETTVTGALVCVCCVAFFMSIEFVTGRNLFAALGGVPAETIVRGGRLRCQGAFAHPIMAGVFGASWAPLALTFWWRNQRTKAVLGVGAGVLIAVFSASSTPILSLAVGFVALGMWRFRRYMRLVRWATLALLVFLHFAREKPVWHLLSRINVLGSSTGWHRYWVIDRAITYFGEWWLLGTAEISHWRIHWNDVTNAYVAAGINGGLLAMASLIAIIALCFSRMGRVAKKTELPLFERRFAWGVGSVIAMHAATFLAVVYFGQMSFIWYQQLAFAGSVTEIALRRPVRARQAIAPARRIRAGARARADAGAGASLGKSLTTRRSRPPASG